MKVGDLVSHWVSKRVGVIIEIQDIESYKVRWFTERSGADQEGWHGIFGLYHETRLDPVKKCP